MPTNREKSNFAESGVGLGVKELDFAGHDIVDRAD